MSRRDTKKQACMSTVVGEENESARQTAEAAMVHNISHLKPRTGSLCAWNILTLFMLLCQYLTKPLWSAVSIHWSLWLQIIVRTAVSWAYTSHTQTQHYVLSDSYWQRKQAAVAASTTTTNGTFSFSFKLLRVRPNPFNKILSKVHSLE